MPGLHAKLAPSSASIWLTCTPAMRLAEAFSDHESVYAAEGTLAHALSELLIKRKLRRIREKDFKIALETFKKHDLYNESMLDYCEEYSVFVINRFHEAVARTKGAKIFLETLVDLSMYAPESFGTADVAIVADEILDFVDLKYGKGVPVSAEENEQLMVYALGLYDKYGFLYSIKTIRLTIYQPRISNTNTWSIPVAALLEWGENYVKPRAKMAWEGVGEFVAGEHCKFCKAAPKCRALHDVNMEAAISFFEDPPAPPMSLTDAEMVKVLLASDRLTKWLTTMEEYALREALAGHKYPGMKIVHGRSNRQYKDPEKIEEVLKEHKYTDAEIFNKKLKGITEMENLLGKNDFGALLNIHIIKPDGKPTLVTETDKRKSYDRASEAIQIFGDETTV